MKTVQKQLIFLTSAVVFTGCAQTMYQISKAPEGVKENRQVIDSNQCYEDSKINVLSSILFCGVGAPVCKSIRDSRYEECMSALGYQVKAIR